MKAGLKLFFPDREPEVVSREFVIRNPSARLWRRMMDFTNTINSCKSGRHRGGSMLLRGADAEKRADGTWRVKVSWWLVPGRARGRARPRRFEVYQYADHGKFIKELVSLAA